jgi:hypothetical protein
VGDILKHTLALTVDYHSAVEPLAQYLIDLFGLEMSVEIKGRLVDFLMLRVENKIDSFELQERLDAPITAGGIGLYQNTAGKMAKEMETIMLLKYTA